MNFFLKKRKLTPVLLTVVIIATANGHAASEAQWRQDIDAVVNNVRATHPDPFFKTGRVTFLRTAQAFKKNLSNLSEEERMVHAMQLIASLGDGHSILTPHENPLFSWWYPVRIYEFTDGYFVVSAHTSSAELAGAQVLEVDGRPVEEAVAAARSVIGGDNNFYNMERLDYFSNAGVMKGLGFAHDNRSMLVKFKLQNGRAIEQTLIPQPSSGRFPENDSTDSWRYSREVLGPPFGEYADWISAYQNTPASEFIVNNLERPGHLTTATRFAARGYPKSNAYYIQVNVVGNAQSESLVEFFQHTLREVDQQKPKNLILDLRYNFGGDGSLITRVVGEFLQRRANQSWENFYIFTGRRTFSASVLWIDAFLDFVAPVTLVGEPAGAPLNTFGDTNSFYYDKTGFRLSVSYERHEKDKSTNIDLHIPVDVPAQFSSRDYIEGRDPALDPILAGEEMRSIPVIALTSGAEPARKTYRNRLTKFSELEWWGRPTEASLREVMRMLSDSGNINQAVKVAELNTEINSTEWRTWYNLGTTQLAVGEKQKAIESYKKCLALNDPTNFNTNYLTNRIAELTAELAQE